MHVRIQGGSRDLEPPLSAHDVGFNIEPKAGPPCPPLLRVDPPPFQTSCIHLWYVKGGSGK